MIHGIIVTSTISSCDRVRISTAHEDKLGGVNEDGVSTKGRAALNPTCSILRPECFNGLLCVAIKRCPSWSGIINPFNGSHVFAVLVLRRGGWNRKKNCDDGCESNKTQRSKHGMNVWFFYNNAGGDGWYWERVIINPEKHGLSFFFLGYHGWLVGWLK